MLNTNQNKAIIKSQYVQKDVQTCDVELCFFSAF